MYLVLLVLGIACMVAAAFGAAPKGINLWYLGWAFVISAHTLPGVSHAY